MKKILITGSNGLLGQSLIQLVTSAGRVNLIAGSKGPNRYPYDGGYQYVALDISDKAQLKRVVAEQKPDTIINTAAITNVDICHKERELCWRVNVDAVANLIEICQSADIHLIHLSTDFVFDGAAGPYAEDAAPNPISYYGESKYAAEKLLQQSACRWAILRTILVYGVTANMSRSNIVLWVKSSLEKGEKIRVVADQWRMPTLATDLAEACLLTAKKEAVGVFHISGKDMMTVYDIACQVADYWQLDSSLIEPVSSASLGQEAKRPAKTGFILDKAARELDYQPHSFLEGFQIVEQQLKALAVKSEF